MKVIAKHQIAYNGKGYTAGEEFELKDNDYAQYAGDVKPATAFRQVKQPKVDNVVTKSISNRTLSALQDAGISLEDARKLSKNELLEIEGIGEKSAQEIKQ